MGSYVPTPLEERQQMLQTLGLETIDALYREIPAASRCGELDLPAGKSELEVRRLVQGLAGMNKQYATVFRGAGAYRHYIPSIVKQVASKETFVTAYTPYQAEISQGVLQAIFEFQTDICTLTGMELANASVYDGATAAAEAITMCRERKRQVALVASSVDPQARQVINTYSASGDAPVQTAGTKGGLLDLDALAGQLNDEVACLYLQSPNYCGLLEPVEQAAALCHAAGVKLVVGCNPIALGLLQTPGEAGADIAVGEGQPLGMPLSFGGPYLGFIACTKALMRRIPGRVVGQTVDADGKRCFVLTLQAREQHIRREKALSSICSNQALCALTASAYLAAMGPQGVAKAAEQCYSKAHYMAQQLAAAGFKRRYEGEFFHEFLTDCPVEAALLEQTLEQKGVLGPLPVQDGLLWCCTEMNSREEIDEAVALCRELLQQSASTGGKEAAQ